MTDPQVFYNREDLWVAPQEKYDGKVSPMEPYYILMKLPGSEKMEYLIMSSVHAAKEGQHDRLAGRKMRFS